MIVFFTLLSGCGFHLRQAPHALHHIRISSDQPYSHFVKHLSHYFKEPNPSKLITLHILAVDEEQVLTGVGGNPQTRQYRLRTTVTYRLLDPCNNPIRTTETLQAERTQTMQTSQIMGASNETSMLYRQMEKEIANTLYYRLASKEIQRLLEKNWDKSC